MKIADIILLLLYAAILTACIPYVPDEQQTKLWMSEDERIASFARSMDYMIGKEFYTAAPKSKWCSENSCTRIDQSVTEYTETIVDDESRECEIAWRVDESQSEGNYQYGTGPVSYGQGKTISWRYLSSPDQCLTTIGFGQPW